MSSRLFARIARLVACASALALAGCAGVDLSGIGGGIGGPVVSSPGGGKAKPIPAHALNVKSDCSWKDETGYNGAMKLRVAQGLVQEFSATVNHPKHGTCRFNLADFHQTKDFPTVELKGNVSRCAVRMWEQGRQIAVGFDNCNANCSGDAVDYLWPILADAYNGSCG